MRSGHVHFGRTATWKGTQDRCERQDRFGLDLQINREGVAVQTPKGGNSEFPSYLRPEALPGHIQPFLVLRPGECRLSHVGQQIYSISRDAFSCHRSISQYSLLDHRFPLLVTLFAIIGLPFLFSHAGARPLSLSSLQRLIARLS